MKSLVCLAAALAALGLAPLAHAEQLEKPAIRASTYSLDIGSHLRWFGDTSAAVLSGDALAGPRITLGRSLTRTRVPTRDVDVGVFVRWHYATVQGEMFRTLESSLSEHALGAGARFDAPLWWRFRLVGTAELGAQRTALQIADGPMTPVDDHAWAPYAATTLGLDVGIIQTPRFRFGLGVDLGYTVTKPVDLSATPADRPDEQLSIETAYSSIGSLDTRGFTYSAAFRGAF